MEIPFKLSYFDTGNHRAFKSLQRQDCGFSVIELECRPIRHPSFIRGKSFKRKFMRKILIVRCYK